MVTIPVLLLIGLVVVGWLLWCGVRALHVAAAVVLGLLLAHTATGAQVHALIAGLVH